MSRAKPELQAVARAAAEGVAIALAARQQRSRRPIKIICGIPTEIFEATRINPNSMGGFTVGRVTATNL